MKTYLAYRATTKYVCQVLVFLVLYWWSEAAEKKVRHCLSMVLSLQPPTGSRYVTVKPWTSPNSGTSMPQGLKWMKS